MSTVIACLPYACMEYQRALSVAPSPSRTVKQELCFDYITRTIPGMPGTAFIFPAMLQPTETGSREILQGVVDFMQAD